MKQNAKLPRLILSIVTVLVVAAIGVTMALQVAGVVDVTNLFTVGSNSTSISESGSGEAKEAAVHNAGTSPVYVRARIVVDPTKPGQVQYTTDASAQKQAGVITVVLSPEADGWKQVGEYYYYQQIVPAGGDTANLVQKVLVGEGIGYEFDVSVYEESALAAGGTYDQAQAEAAFASLDRP